MEELEKIVPSLSDNEYIRDDSLQFWYSDFQVIPTSVIVKLTHYTLQLKTKLNMTEDSFMKRIGQFLLGRGSLKNRLTSMEVYS